MKFAEHLLAHITPEWRRQYIVYEDMKTMLYEAVENLPSIEMADPQEIERLVRAFDENFLAFCEKELFKINVFYEEKLAEAKRKFDTLRKEMDTLALESQNQGKRRSVLSPLQRLISNASIGDESGQQQQLQQQRFHHHELPDPKTPLAALAASELGLRSQIRARASAVTINRLPSISSGLTGQASRRHSMAAGWQGNQASKQSAKAQHRVVQISKQQHFQDNNKQTRQSQPQQQPEQRPQLPQQQQKEPQPTAKTALVGYIKPATNHAPAPVTNPSYPNYGTIFDTTNGIDKRKLDDLKLAFSEFYLSLVLLQNYQRLNFTGFRKIFKKHDKLLGNDEGNRWHHAHVENAFFHTNKDVDKLIEDTENIVTFQLESGDRQKAMKRLRVPPLNDIPQPWTAFRVGFALGALVVLAVAVALTGIFQQTGDDWRIVFRLYRSSLFIIVFIFLVGINIYGWRARGVNHVLIFELDPRDHLSGQDLLEISFSFGVLWCLSVLLFLWSGPIGIPPLINPIILNLIMLIYLLNPTKTFHYSARIWLICCIVSIPSTS